MNWRRVSCIVARTHTPMLIVLPGSIFLRCPCCLWESPGVTVTRARTPTPTPSADRADDPSIMLLNPAPLVK